MFFSDKFIDENNVDVAYLCEYLTYANFGHMDRRSEDFVLKFKDGDSQAVKKAFDEIYPQLGDNFAIAVIPPSDPEENFKTSCHDLCDKIVKQAQKDGKNITNASECLIRTKKVTPKHLTPGQRTTKHDIDSIKVINQDRIYNKDILVIDDIVTSGSSMQAAKILLKRANANEVKGFAIGKTVSKYTDPMNSNLRYGFILDLDQTLFNTEHIKEYRERREWNTACDLAERCEEDIDIRNFVGELEYGCDGDIYIVTNAPKHYATILAEKLIIDKDHIIAYHDCKDHKPKVEPYLRAKQLMGIYEGCIVVVGDEEEDLIPAKELGMTAVRANWFREPREKSKYADFEYNSTEDFVNDLQRILEKADSFRSRV